MNFVFHFAVVIPANRGNLPWPVFSPQVSGRYHLFQRNNLWVDDKGD
jgi:hypothetical protein